MSGDGGEAAGGGGGLKEGEGGRKGGEKRASGSVSLRLRLMHRDSHLEGFHFP